jgi:hypothetical protein
LAAEFAALLEALERSALRNLVNYISQHLGPFRVQAKLALIGVALLNMVEDDFAGISG